MGLVMQRATALLAFVFHLPTEPVKVTCVASLEILRLVAGGGVEGLI